MEPQDIDVGDSAGYEGPADAGDMEFTQHQRYDEVGEDIRG